MKDMYYTNLPDDYAVREYETPYYPENGGFDKEEIERILKEEVPNSVDNSVDNRNPSDTPTSVDTPTPVVTGNDGEKEGEIGWFEKTIDIMGVEIPVVLLIAGVGLGFFMMKDK